MATTEQIQIQRIMAGLHCSEEEAKEIYASDREIDRGAKLFELSAEAQKASKQARQTPRKPTAYNFDTSKRQRKENATKGSIIAELAKFLTENSENATKNVQITNKERQIAFTIGSESYELTLVQKRKPK